MPDLLPPKEIGEARLDRRRRMRDAVDQTVKDFESSENAALMDQNFKTAFTLMTSTRAREAFDLTKEPEKVRERYGMSRFGQCCLLARRLIEAGVRFVTVNTFITVFDEITWDIHGSKPFTSIEGMKEIVCPMYDQGYSALIEDLDKRGMLPKTMVCNLAEFGRTPQVNKDAGRDHWSNAMSVLFAGGGTPGGKIVGATDRKGFAAVERVLSPENFASTVYAKLGLDPGKILHTPEGRPVHMVSDPTPIKELMG